MPATGLGTLPRAPRYVGAPGAREGGDQRGMRATGDMCWAKCVAYILSCEGCIIRQCLWMPKMPSMKHSHNSNAGLTVPKPTVFPGLLAVSQKS